MTQLVYDLSSPEDKALFLERVCNKKLRVWSKALSEKPRDREVVCALTYHGETVVDRVTYSAAKVELVAVPRFLFGAAKNATTLRFRLLPPGLDGFEFTVVCAEFRVDGRKRFEYANFFSDRTAGVDTDGKLFTLNEAYRKRLTTYELYVPSSEYSVLKVDGYVSKSSSYVVTPIIRTGGHGCVLSSGEDQGRIEYFADYRVPAVDVPQGKATGPKRDPGVNTLIDLQPQMRFEGVKGLAMHPTGMKFLPSGGVKPNDSYSGYYWDMPKVPQYTRYQQWVQMGKESWTADKPKSIFQLANMVSGWHYSLAHFERPRDTICDVALEGVYAPVVGAKNYGKREGMWVNVSYGTKSKASHPALGDVLYGGEGAMDYSKKSGTIELYFFDGRARVNVRVENGTTVNDVFGGLAAHIGSLLAKTDPVLDGFWQGGKTMYDVVDKIKKPEAANAGRAMFAAYWSRRNPDNPAADEIGKTVVNPVYQSPGVKYTIQVPNVNVDVGQSCFLYVDYATWVQEKAEGYLDVWGAIAPPACWAEVDLAEDTTVTPQIYYKLYER